MKALRFIGEAITFYALLGAIAFWMLALAPPEPDFHAEYAQEVAYVRH